MRRCLAAPMPLFAVGLWCAILTATPTAAPAAPGAHIAWDWNGIIGTGQSLSIGAHGLPVRDTHQPYGNLKLSTGELPWPVNPDDASLTMVPLIEPIGRRAPAYPSSWPENIDGETYHTAMADELTSLVAANFHRDFISVHSEVGEDGQGMIFIRKHPEHVGVNGHSYRAAMIEATAIDRLAKAAGETFGVGAVVVTHGETDCGNADYENQLHLLWQNYNADLKAITGQKQNVLMILSQQNSLLDHSASTIAQWRCSDDYPKHMVCSGPKYQYPYYQDAIHLTVQGYRELGEKYAEVYYHRVILAQPWIPLEPTAIARAGDVITVRFHVPNPPLVWDTAMSAPHRSTPQWAGGKGFEVTSALGANIAIRSVGVSGDTVTIVCASDPGPNALVGYAMVGDRGVMTSPYNGTHRWGLLRDSDPFVGALSAVAQPNYCIAFEEKAP